MISKQTRDASRLRRLREPRWFIVAAGVTFMVILTALAFVQQPTVAAPPPPLAGELRFIEVPQEARPALSKQDLITPTVVLSETFDNFVLTNNPTVSNPGLQLFVSRDAANQKWGQVWTSDGIFVNTLWSTGFYTHFQTANATYVRNMDTWAIYGPLDANNYRDFVASFDLWPDMDIQGDTKVGWAASIDGQNFCGNLELMSSSKAWLPKRFVLPKSCSGQTGTPTYLAFYFHSDSRPPVGLGAFLDNLIITGLPPYKSYFPLVRRDPTPTASPTPQIVRGVLVRPKFDFTGEEDPRWCENDNDSGGWTAVREPVGDGSRGNSYRLGFAIPGRTMLQSNHFDHDNMTPDYGIETEFSLLDMAGIDRTKYPGVKFGLFFGVEGSGDTDYPIWPWDDSHCTWYEDRGGYYRAFIRIKDDGSGYEYRLQKVDHNGKTDLDSNTTATVKINETGWNTMRVNRSGANILVYVNDVQVLAATEGTWQNKRWWGFMVDEPSGYGGNQPFRVNFDNTGVYDLTP